MGRRAAAEAHVGNLEGRLPQDARLGRTQPHAIGDATVPNGATSDLVRIVTENARTLKFDSQGFESE
jgi:hypothetical protein